MNGQRYTVCAACDGTQVAFYSSTDQSVLVARPELSHLGTPPAPSALVLYPANMRRRAAYGVQRAAGLVDTPCNILNTSEFVATARRQAASVEVATEGARVSVEVIEGEDLREKGYGGIYGVGKAAAHPPALVILHYEPPTPTEYALSERRHSLRERLLSLVSHVTCPQNSGVGRKGHCL